MSVTFRVVPHGGDDYAACVKLREAILRVPLGLAFTDEEIAAEHDQTHIAGFDADGVLCATCALVAYGDDTLKMQRVAVADGRQGQGIGAGLLGFCETHARENGYRTIIANARGTAAPFYEKHGYMTEGEPFEEQGIPHIRVTRDII